MTSGSKRPAVSRADLVDEFAQLDTELNSLKGKTKRRDDLRETILGWHADLPADQQTTENGHYYDVIVSLPDNRRVFTMAGKRKLFRLWGSTKFIERCAIALKFLPDPKDEAGEFTVNGRTGPRHLEVLPRLKLAA